MLRWLVVEEVLAEEEGGRFALTELGGCLRSDVPGSLRGPIVVRGELYYQAAGGPVAGGTEGRHGVRAGLRDRFFEHLARDPDREAAFQASMDRCCTTGSTPTPTDCWGPAGRR
jgi:hypothetical protein